MQSAATRKASNNLDDFFIPLTFSDSQLFIYEADTFHATAFLTYAALNLFWSVLKRVSRRIYTSIAMQRHLLGRMCLNVHFG